MRKIILNSVLASEIAESLQKKLYGEDIVIYGPCTIKNIKSNALLYVEDVNLIEKIDFTKFNEILVLTSKEHLELKNLTYILTDNPISDFFKVLDSFFTKLVEYYVHEDSLIEDGARIGNKVLISPGCYIGADVSIGENTIIWENVVIKGSVKIGKNCTVKPNAVIGSDVFNFILSEEKWEQFPQIGEIIIEDDVLIGSSSTIEKGTMENTIIKKGVKIDDLVQIGSNCVVGNDTFIAAGTIVSRDVRIGEDCWIAPNVSIRDQIIIGDKAIIGIGSVVVKDVLPNQTVAGNPAIVLQK